MRRVDWKQAARLVRHAVLLLFGFLLVGNLVILTLHGVASAKVGVDQVDGIGGVNHLRRIDGRVWGGSNPTREGYAELAAAGVTTVVDLRAEQDAHADDDYVTSLGLQVVHLPIRDGQTPTGDDVDAFIKTVDASTGTVFLHCGAGVGRTGSMAAAYLVGTDQADADDLIGQSLAVGPPSLEQLFFIGALDSGRRPPALVVGASRVLDAPRRIWSDLRG